MVKACFFSTCLFVVGMVAPANATMIHQLNSNTGVGSGPSYGGAFEGSIEWHYDTGNMATVTLSLTNSSSVVSNLCAFVVGSSDSTMAFSLISSPTNFTQLTGNGLRATPFGDFDWGSSSTGSFNGGGNNMGLTQGETGIWVFSVSGTPASLAAVSDSEVYNGVNLWDFVVRIKGITSGTETVSEKLTSTFVIVPAPGVAALAGLVGLTKRRRRE